MSYFQAVRLYSIFELAIFTALIVVWAGGFDDHTQQVLGWCHGFGWIGLCVAIFVGCTRGVFPWPVLAGAVSPLGPLGSTIGIEVTARQRRRALAGVNGH
jgi:hypothetical protein